MVNSNPFFPELPEEQALAARVLAQAELPSSREQRGNKFERASALYFQAVFENAQRPESERLYFRGKTSAAMLQKLSKQLHTQQVNRNHNPTPTPNPTLTLTLTLTM